MERSIYVNAARTKDKRRALFRFAPIGAATESIIWLSNFKIHHPDSEVQNFWTTGSHFQRWFELNEDVNALSASSVFAGIEIDEDCLEFKPQKFDDLKLERQKPASFAKTPKDCLVKRASQEGKTIAFENRLHRSSCVVYTDNLVRRTLSRNWKIDETLKCWKEL